MQFALAPEQERFRAAVREFFAEGRVRKAIAELSAMPPRQEPGMHEVYRWLGERGWLAPSWPREYGGLGATPVEAAIVSEELALHGVPDLVHALSVDIVGMFLLRFGSPEQRARLLPPIARGERSATVLYSEPGVGSDLVSLQTRAVPDGDGWRLNGRKIYSQKTQFADHAVCAARTADGPGPYDGITLFVLDLRADGVHVGALPNLSDDRFSDVTLLGARVGKQDVLGPVGGGWGVINSVLKLERTGIDFHGKARRWLDTILRRALELGAFDDPVMAQRLVELDARVEAGRLLAWKVVGQLERDDVDEVATAMSKWHNTEVARDLVRLGMDLEGLDGTLSRWDGEAPAGGLLEAAAREAPGLTLSAGSSEIMLYLIASSGLRVYEDPPAEAGAEAGGQAPGEAVHNGPQAQ